MVSSDWKMKLSAFDFVAAVMVFSGRDAITRDFEAISRVFYLLSIDRTLGVQDFFRRESYGGGYIVFNDFQTTYPFSGKLHDLLQSLFGAGVLVLYFNTDKYRIDVGLAEEIEQELRECDDITPNDIDRIRAAGRRFGELIPGPNYDPKDFRAVFTSLEAELLIAAEIYQC